MDDKDRLVVFQHGGVENLPLEDFPPGEVYLEALKKHGVKVPTHQEEPSYWQACARWSMLKNFGLWNDKDCILYEEAEISGEAEASKPQVRLVLSDEQISAINQQWMHAIIRTNEKSAAQGTCINDLLEFLETGTSNQRPLQFASMKIARGYELHCHAHPNLELAYCVSGALHEIRVLEGREPLMPKQGTENKELQGPNMSSVDEKDWRVETLCAGQWLVNPVGSIHKSFTDTSQGCLLVLLFGGAEANVENEHIHEHQLKEAIKCVNRRESKAEA